MINNKTYNIYIGIDPDSVKSGVCLCKGTDIQYLDELSFFDLIDYIKTISDGLKNLTVVIESGWLKKGIWHNDLGNNKIGKEIAKKVGRNHQTGVLIKEYCEQKNIKYILKTPNNKKKFTITNFRTMTKYKGRLTQDMVDAAIMVYGM